MNVHLPKAFRMGGSPPTVAEVYAITQMPRTEWRRLVDAEIAGINGLFADIRAQRGQPHPNYRPAGPGAHSRPAGRYPQQPPRPRRSRQADEAFADLAGRLAADQVLDDARQRLSFDAALENLGCRLRRGLS